MFPATKHFPRIGMAVVLFAGLYLSSLYSYLLFHTLAEMFSILIAWMVFILAWNSRRFLENGYLLFLGISLLFVGGIDFVHTLAYKGMAIFQGFDANLPTQLWIAARYMQSLSLLIAPFWIRRPLRISPALAGFTLVTTVLLVSIFTGFFPDCFIEGSGLTRFKIASEYIIIAILAFSIVTLLRSRKAFNRKLQQFLVFAILASIAAELAFTSYMSVYGPSNLLGHFFKILTFYLIYKAIIETGFTQPFELLVYDLHQREAALQLSHNHLEQLNGQLHEAISQAEQRAEELEAVLSELHRAQLELKDYTGKLESSNRELEQFASVASHDLQEPLRKISLFGQRLQDRAAARLDESECSYLERMLDAAHRMQTMIDALLTYSRVTTKAQPYTPVDLQQVAREVVSDLEARLEQTGGRVEIGELPVIKADPLQMRQLLQNLIGNALKFSKRGVPPKVSVWGRSATSDQGLATMDSFLVADCQSAVTVIVEDNGIGFDPQYLDKIFKPFERLHGRGEYEGTGMGLAICQKIVERHHGTITATSVPGEGSTFLISLPLKQADAIVDPEVQVSELA
jgi:signal transduction histidine kinase